MLDYYEFADDGRTPRLASMFGFDKGRTVMKPWPPKDALVLDKFPKAGTTQSQLNERFVGEVFWQGTVTRVQQGMAGTPAEIEIELPVPEHTATAVILPAKARLILAAPGGEKSPRVGERITFLGELIMRHDTVLGFFTTSFPVTSLYGIGSHAGKVVVTIEIRNVKLLNTGR
ncbi:MAG: hypothetical protein HYR84_16385 [Planctomycetes bacterium]|nr:hypothetical protein [Planctomycetota bacterium]